MHEEKFSSYSEQTFIAKAFLQKYFRKKRFQYFCRSKTEKLHFERMQKPEGNTEAQYDS